MIKQHQPSINLIKQIGCGVKTLIRPFKLCLLQLLLLPERLETSKVERPRMKLVEEVVDRVGVARIFKTWHAVYEEVCMAWNLCASQWSYTVNSLCSIHSHHFLSIQCGGKKKRTKVWVVVFTSLEKLRLMGKGETSEAHWDLAYTCTCRCNVIPPPLGYNEGF